jgi:glycosyltransferase involved in cell wall biosynthesis
LVIAGPDAGARASFEQLVASRNISDRVHLVGPAYGPEKFAAMVDALCFVLPSEHECFSMAILEAMACSVPVVISEESHFPEVREAGAGFVLPRTAGGFADAIEQLVLHPEKRSEMGAAGLRMVNERYTWDGVAQLSLAAYERAIPKG